METLYILLQLESKYKIPECDCWGGYTVPGLPIVAATALETERDPAILSHSRKLAFSTLLTSLPAHLPASFLYQQPDG